MKEIVEKNNGQIIKEGENIFDPYIIKCQNDHQFQIYSNDLKRGLWCPECDKIDKILKDIDIQFTKNTMIDKITFKYVIDTDSRKFIIEDGPLTETKYKIANKKEYNIIAVFDRNCDNLKDKIWEALKNNESVDIGKTLEYNESHRCNKEEVIKFINKDVRSVIKRAQKPYPDMVNIAVGYIRVSTEKQVSEGHSLKSQEALLAKEASRRNFFLRAIYIDEGISGKNIEHRESLKRLMKDLEAGEKVIAYAVERFSRNLADLLKLAEEINEKKCEFIVPDMDVDFNTPHGKMMLTMRGMFAQYEREMTSKRVKDNHEYLKEHNRYISKPFYGWKVNPDKSPGKPLYVRVEEEQKIIENIRLMKESYPKLGITKFTKKVNQHLEPPRKAREWHHKMLKDLMIREGIVKKI